MSSYKEIRDTSSSIDLSRSYLRPKADIDEKILDRQGYTKSLEDIQFITKNPPATSYSRFQKLLKSYEGETRCETMHRLNCFILYNMRGVMNNYVVSRNPAKVTFQVTITKYKYKQITEIKDLEDKIIEETVQVSTPQEISQSSEDICVTQMAFPRRKINVAARLLSTASKKVTVQVKVDKLIKRMKKVQKLMNNEYRKDDYRKLQTFWERLNKSAEKLKEDFNLDVKMPIVVKREDRYLISSVKPPPCRPSGTERYKVIKTVEKIKKPKKLKKDMELHERMTKEYKNNTHFLRELKKASKKDRTLIPYSKRYIFQYTDEEIDFMRSKGL